MYGRLACTAFDRTNSEVQSFQGVFHFGAMGKRRSICKYGLSEATGQLSFRDPYHIYTIVLFAASTLTLTYPLSTWAEGSERHSRETDRTKRQIRMMCNVGMGNSFCLAQRRRSSNSLTKSLSKVRPRLWLVTDPDYLGWLASQAVVAACKRKQLETTSEVSAH